MFRACTENQSNAPLVNQSAKNPLTTIETPHREHTPPYVETSPRVGDSILVASEKLDNKNVLACKAQEALFMANFYVELSDECIASTEDAPTFGETVSIRTAELFLAPSTSCLHQDNSNDYQSLEKKQDANYPDVLSSATTRIPVTSLLNTTAKSATPTHPPQSPIPQTPSSPPLNSDTLSANFSNDTFADLRRTTQSSSSSRCGTSNIEAMRVGQHHLQFDKELAMEHERCNAACWRFNDGANPNRGFSEDERRRLFWDILRPKRLYPPLVSSTTPSAHANCDVVVEAPFNCEYGHNIHIGQNVSIGRNCTILDACEVSIGDRCVLGPNVSIYTASLSTDPEIRARNMGSNQARPIIIEEDCWIGGGATILPGRTIRKGSTVGAGSVVTKVCSHARMRWIVPSSTNKIRTLRPTLSFAVTRHG